MTTTSAAPPTAERGPVASCGDGGGVQITSNPPVADIRREMLTQARAELRCALTQAGPTDDQIIVNHMRMALVHLDVLEALYP